MARGGWQDSPKYEKIELTPEIEDNIEQPKKSRIVLGFPFSALQVNQSFGVALEYRDALQRQAADYSTKHNMVLSVRTMTNPKTKVKEARCFRLK